MEQHTAGRPETDEEKQARVAAKTAADAAEKTAAEALAKQLDGLIVGRIVWYTPLFAVPGETDPTKREPLAAIVTRVQDATTGLIALCAFPPFGSMGQGWPNVPFSAVGDHGTWRWPGKAKP